MLVVRPKDWTFDAIALRGGLRREEVNKVELGGNKATSGRMRSGLAKAFGVTEAEVATWLDGTTSTEEMFERILAPPRRGADHVSPHLEQVLQEFGELLTYRQGEDLRALAAAKGATLEDIRAMAQHMMTKREKRVPEREAGPPEKRPKTRRR
jgi:hypothetical protein